MTAAIDPWTQREAQGIASERSTSPNAPLRKCLERLDLREWRGLATAIPASLP